MTTVLRHSCLGTKNNDEMNHIADNDYEELMEESKHCECSYTHHDSNDAARSSRGDARSDGEEDATRSLEMDDEDETNGNEDEMGNEKQPATLPREASLVSPEARTKVQAAG